MQIQIIVDGDVAYTAECATSRTARRLADDVATILGSMGFGLDSEPVRMDPIVLLTRWAVLSGAGAVEYATLARIFKIAPSTVRGHALAAINSVESDAASMLEQEVGDDGELPAAIFLNPGIVADILTELEGGASTHAVAKKYDMTVGDVGRLASELGQKL
jgi:hypothetical protein